jgi:hypothetical protein
VIPAPPPVASGVPRRLVIVRQDHLALYRYLSERLDGVAYVDVILDRRLTATPAPAAASERRRPLGRRERDHWRSLGYRLADAIRAEPSASEETGPADS